MVVFPLYHRTVDWLCFRVTPCIQLLLERRSALQCCQGDVTSLQGKSPEIHYRLNHLGTNSSYNKYLFGSLSLPDTFITQILANHGKQGR